MVFCSSAYTISIKFTITGTFYLLIICSSSHYNLHLIMVSILRELQNLSEKKRKYTLKEYVTIQ